MNPMVTLILLGEKRLEIEQQRHGQRRFGLDEILVEGWSKPKHRTSFLARLPRLQLNRHQPSRECLPETGC